ncbi:MAG: pitrilysin family protein [Planctomycetaceae bacterium]
MKLRIGFSLAGCFAAVLFATLSLAGAEATKPMKVTTIEGISEYRLENGLKVLLFPDPSKPTVTVNLTVLVGSRHEGYGEAGMAHLLEHMLFKGTPDHPQIPKALQARGAEFNGTTWLDRTNYFETLPANDDNLEFAIALEADRMINSHIKGEELASEMTVVRNEFERGENAPQYVLSQKMTSAAYEWHNYGKSTIGNRADIERVPVESLRRFYRRFYQPDNAVLVVAGRFDEQKALEYIGKHFGTIPRPDRVLEDTYTEEPAQDGERMVTLRRVGDVAVVGAMYHIPAGAHPDYPAIDVLEAILTQQPSGRLYKALVEQKKAASVSGAAYALHDPGLLRFMAEVSSGNSPETVLEAMLDALQVVIDQGVTNEEVERAKQRLLKQRELQASDSTDIAVELSEWAAQGDWRLYFLYRDRLENVTAKDVDRVARAYLEPTNRTVGLYIPTEKPQRTTVPQVESLADMIGDYQGREATDAGEEFDVAPAAIEARTKRFEIDGIKVAFLPKKTRGSTVVLRITLRYGSEDSLRGQVKATEFLPVMMMRGTKHLTRQQLQDQLDQNLATMVTAAQLRESPLPGEVTFVVQTKRDKLPAVLDIVRQVVREPIFPAAEFDVLKQQHQADLEQGLSDPQELAIRAVRQKLNPYKKDDPRYYPTVQEEIIMANDLDVAAVRRLYTDFVSAQSGQIAVVGDFDEEVVQKSLQGMLKNWKSKQPYARIPRPAQSMPKSEVVKLLTPDKANAFYFSGEVFPLQDDHPDYPALVIGNYIFGAGALSSRLGDRIRQKEGLSYGVGSSFGASALDPRASLTIYAIFNPENLGKVTAGIKEELEKLLKDGVTQQELDSARDGYLQRQAVGRTEDVNLARILDDTLYTNRTMEHFTKLEERIQALTQEEILAAWKKHVDPARLFTAVAGDFKSSSASDGK